MQPVGVMRGTWEGRLGPHPVLEYGRKMFLGIIGTNLLDFMVLKSRRE